MQRMLWELDHSVAEKCPIILEQFLEDKKVDTLKGGSKNYGAIGSSSRAIYNIANKLSF